MSLSCRITRFERELRRGDNVGFCHYSLWLQVFEDDAVCCFKQAGKQRRFPCRFIWWKTREANPRSTGMDEGMICVCLCTWCCLNGRGYISTNMSCHCRSLPACKYTMLQWRSTKKESWRNHRRYIVIFSILLSSRRYALYIHVHTRGSSSINMCCLV